MSLRRCACLVLALVFSACASSPDTPFEGDSETAGVPSRGNARLIVRAELDQLYGRSAWEVVETLHRRWLRSGRGGSLTSGPVFARVVIDGTFPGELIELRGLSANDIENMRYFPPSEATTKYGTGYLGGVIEVTTRGR